MMRMGPEALSVKFKTDPRADLALFAQLELARRDLHEGEAALRMEQEYLPVTYSAARRLVRWGRQWLRSDEATATGHTTARPRAGRMAEGRALPARPLEATSLAALPALRAGARPQGLAPPISATPILARI